MNQRHHANSNLTLHYDSQFNGYPVNTKHGPLVQNYLTKTEKTINNALQAHLRTFVIGLCLRIPAGLTIVPSDVISRFFASLKAQISHDRKMAAQVNQRVHLTGVRYVWAKERDGSVHDHYHVLIFLNSDAYHMLGDILADDGNMAARVVKAWATALMLYPDDVRNSVQFTGNGTYKATDAQEVQNLFYWASYFSKAETKHYGDSGRSFGTSIS